MHVYAMALESDTFYRWPPQPQITVKKTGDRLSPHFHLIVALRVVSGLLPRLSRRRPWRSRVESSRGVVWPPTPPSSSLALFCFLRPETRLHAVPVDVEQLFAHEATNSNSSLKR
ncbi:unnamed protein product [Soboliphyme baturini]|uniref:Rep protein n=1 Tax=Soboliphyme baturini TaxID=241478 RepID=A0A183ICN7_9BILA|nr:unnamed protein product [Soboliphyme baturini]